MPKEGLLASLRIVRTEAGLRFSTGLQTQGGAGDSDRLSKTVNIDGDLADTQALAGRVHLAVTQVAEAIEQHLVAELAGEPAIEPRDFDGSAAEGELGADATALLGAPAPQSADDTEAVA